MTNAKSAAVCRRRESGTAVGGFGAFVLAALLAGCVIGDGYVLVKGRVVSESGEPLSGCELALFLKGEPTDFAVAAERVYVDAIEHEFRSGFAISPLRESYYFAVRCPGYVMPYRSPTYSFNGGTYAIDAPDRRLDLGTIVMKQ